MTGSALPSGSTSDCSAGNQTGCISTGTYPSQSTPLSPAGNSDVLNGKQFYAGGAELNGTMVDRGSAWDLTTAFPGTGKYSGIASAISAAQVCTGRNFLGSAATAVCQGPSGGGNAPANAVLSGRYFWNSLGVSTLGTMTDHGALNLDTTVIPGTSVGYYTSVSSTLTNATVCSSKNLFGSAGTAVCEGASGGTNSTAANVLAATYFWDSTGTSTLGTMSNRGTFDASVTFPGSGYYSGVVSNAPAATAVCSGTTVLGTPGTANCSGVTLESNAFRDAGAIVLSFLSDQQTISTQLTQSAEVTTYAGSGGTPDLPTTGGYKYRSIPDVTKDDEGYLGTTTKYAPRPTNCATTGRCGTAGTIATRIANCVTKQGALATWDGSVNGNSGQSVWNLVSCSAANKEVWQDQRTGLFWSSVVTTSANWCKATGNTQAPPVTFTQHYNNAAGTAFTGNGSISSITGGASSENETITIKFSSATAFAVTSNATGCSDAQGGTTSGGPLTITAGSSITYGRAGYCSFTLTQGSVNFAANDTLILQSLNSNGDCTPGGALQGATPVSYCAEGAGFSQTPVAGENWAATPATYATSKGGMGAGSVTKVYWRLPTKSDYSQADVDGIRMVMPDMGSVGSTRSSPDASTGGNTEWAATLLSSTRTAAWFFISDDGTMGNGGPLTGRNSAYHVRCVGR